MAFLTIHEGHHSNSSSSPPQGQRRHGSPPESNVWLLRGVVTEGHVLSKEEEVNGKDPEKLVDVRICDVQTIVSFLGIFCDGQSKGMARGRGRRWPFQAAHTSSIEAIVNVLVPPCCHHPDQKMFTRKKRQSYEVNSRSSWPVPCREISHLSLLVTLPRWLHVFRTLGTQRHSRGISIRPVHTWVALIMRHTTTRATVVETIRGPFYILLLLHGGHWPMKVINLAKREAFVARPPATSPPRDNKRGIVGSDSRFPRHITHPPHRIGSVAACILLAL